MKQKTKKIWYQNNPYKKVVRIDPFWEPFIQKCQGKSFAQKLDNFLTECYMGMLDFVPMKEPEPISKSSGRVPIKCERCGDEFPGQEWMLRTKKEITCPRCWRYEQQDMA